MSNMNEKQNQQFEWAWRGLLVVVLGVCGYFLRDIYIKQTAFNERIDQRVQNLEFFKASTDSSKFTSSDWVSAKSVLDERDVSMDKRITRVEDAIPVIRSTLDKSAIALERIEQKVDRINQSPK